MAKPRHKRDTKTFGELTYVEQAKSITAQINVLQRAIIHHVNGCKTSKKRSEVREKCLAQVNRLLGRLLDKTR